MMRAFLGHAVTVGDLAVVAGAAAFMAGAVYVRWVAIGCPGSRERR